MRLEKEGKGICHAERSCLMRTLDLLQMHNEKGWLGSAEIEQWKKWAEDKRWNRNDQKTVGRRRRKRCEEG